MMINIDEGIAVDAAHSVKNKKTEYRGVDLSTGEIIFYKDLGNQTINIGEFLAIVEAIKYIIKHDFKPKVIFSDSATALSWVANKRTASGKRNSHLIKAEIYLRAMAYWVDQIKCFKWDNRGYGEIPADFGRK